MDRTRNLRQWYFELSLRWHIFLLLAVALVLSLILMGTLSFSQSNRVILDLTLDQMLDDTNAAVHRLEDMVASARINALNTPEFPPIPGLIRCWDNTENPGQDPVQLGSDVDTWKQRLCAILKSQMESYDEWLSCEVYDHDGHGVVRVVRTRRGAAEPFQCEASYYAEVADTEYFRKTRTLKKDEVHVSSMALENGKAIARFCTPFFDEVTDGGTDENTVGTTGNFRGIYVIVVDGRMVLTRASGAIGFTTTSSPESVSAPQSATWTDVVDERGMFLYCEDGRTGAEPFSDDHVRQFMPVRADLMKQADPQFDAYCEFIAGRDQPNGHPLLGSYRKFFFQPDDRSRFWAVLANRDADEPLAPSRQLATWYFLLGSVVLLVVGIAVYFATGPLTSSVKRLSRTVDQISSGDLDVDIHANGAVGEVADLFRSFESMANNLRSQIAEIQHHRSRTEAVLQAAVDAMVTIDEAGTVTSFNAAAESLFGYSVDEIVGKNVAILVPPPHRDRHDQYIRRYLETGDAHVIGHERELEAVRKDGSLFPISLRIGEMRQGEQRFFIGTIQDISDRHHRAHEREKVIKAIRDAVQRLATTTQEILATTTEQSQGAEEQAAAVAQTVSTVVEVAQTSEQAAERASDVANSAKRIGEVGDVGRQAVDDSVAAMAVVKEQVESIAESILSLAERAQAIGEITTTVNDIAEQTNVLALNAAVEASRAGEHGRGFAVVAAEVKSLAEQSKKATAQVRAILGEIQKATNSTVLATEQGTRSVSDANNVIRKAGDTIRELAAAVSESARAAAQISLTSNQQAAGISQLNLGIQNIDRVTKENVLAIRQIEASAEDLDGLSNELASLLGD